ncbi:MAG: proline racemase family protein [Alphaproteobacteria bacterium]|nr:proline racemase family protein [Alphaproteobacteria bacterium]
MENLRAIHIIGAHAEGEVGHVIVGGVLPPPGATVKAQRDWLQTEGDALRRLLIREPRGGVFTHYNLIVPAKDPAAQAGFIIMEPMDYPPMSGSNSICVATVLLETGMLPLTEPDTDLVLETPGGLVKMRCACSGGKVDRVTTTNVPCYVAALDQILAIDGFGEVRLDICYGGAFFALVEAQSVGIEIVPENARAIVELGERIKAAARREHRPNHPTLGDVGGITFVTFLGPIEMDGGTKAARNATVISPGKIDRSPCGTASSARLAAMHARGQLTVGESLISRSILGTEFGMCIEEETAIADIPAIRPSISGRAWITGHHVQMLDPRDPFPEGYSLTDTAYQLF